MYHAIIRAKLRRAFADINRGAYAPVLAQFHPAHAHVFYGAHALAGLRTNMETTAPWYARLARVFPDLRFEIRSVVSSGWPWNTVAAVEWSDHFSVDGRAFSNQGVHVIRLKWGRVVGLEVHCDTQKLCEVLRLKSEGGLAEAAAAPITG